MRNDKLIEILRDQKLRLQQGISEFELIRLLQSPPYSLFSEDGLRDSLGLFQCHFLLFNALHQLRLEWQHAGEGWLDIIATRVQLIPARPAQDELAGADPLADYYLDWNNFDTTRAGDVDKMLDDFWRKMTSLAPMVPQSEIGKALEVLALPLDEPVTLPVLKKHYRSQQHKYHPDKGGTSQQAQTLIWAYETLKRRYAF